jgi:protein TonB
VRPVDRLGFTLFLAALVHLALILGVGFTMVEPANQPHHGHHPGHLQEREGAREGRFPGPGKPAGQRHPGQESVPKTTEVAPFQDSKINKVTPPPPPKPKSPAAPKSVVTTQAPKPQKSTQAEGKQATAQG